MAWLDTHVVAHAPLPTYDPADFTTVYNGDEFTTTQSIDTGDDDTLFVNCHFHDISGRALQIRNVDNIVVFNCLFEDCNGEAVILRNSGSTSNVTIDRNVIRNITNNNGIHATQVHASGINHTNLKILRNNISNTGVGVSGGSKHGIYTQVTDVLIAENRITGTRDGNGISHRSSGIIRDNFVSGSSASNKPCIRYYSDHWTGGTDTLKILRNRCYNDDDGIELYAPTATAEPTNPPTHVVKTFLIEHNITVVGGTGIAWDTAYDSSPYSISTGDGNN